VVERERVIVTLVRIKPSKTAIISPHRQWEKMIFEFQALEKSDIKFMPPFRGGLVHYPLLVPTAFAVYLFRVCGCAALAVRFGCAERFDLPEMVCGYATISGVAE